VCSNHIQKHSEMHLACSIPSVIGIISSQPNHIIHTHFSIELSLMTQSIEAQSVCVSGTVSWFANRSPEENLDRKKSRKTET
jgi:hypothetical protein